MYSKKTSDILITVNPEYLEDQSRPEDHHYVWAYTVNIKNEGQQPIQLRKRHWKITDSQGVTFEVKGEGVVGEQPVIAPGDTYSYTSGTPLPTPGGVMIGSYQVESTDGQSLIIDIPAFSLDSPHTPMVIH